MLGKGCSSQHGEYSFVRHAEWMMHYMGTHTEVHTPHRPVQVAPREGCCGRGLLGDLPPQEMRDLRRPGVDVAAGQAGVSEGVPIGDVVGQLAGVGLAGD